MVLPRADGKLYQIRIFAFFQGRDFWIINAPFALRLAELNMNVVLLVSGRVQMHEKLLVEGLSHAVFNLLDVFFGQIGGNLAFVGAFGQEVLNVTDPQKVVSSGGRVLSVVGRGPDLGAARAQAYERLAAVKLPGSHFRTDIGLAAEEGRISR